MSKILVVDDDRQLRGLACRVLEGAGHFTFQAENGLAAYHMIRELAGDLDLLLIDIHVPAINGVELVRRITPEYPSLKVLCMSGYADPVPPAGYPFLPKPFTPEALLATIERVLRPADLGRGNQATGAH